MENLLASVQAARQAYGPTLTDDECARLCNAVAWQHRASGWGLSRKTSGTRGRLPNGVEVAHDILHHQPTNTLVDVLTAAGAASTPTWNPVGPPQGPDRTFVVPCDPASWVSTTPIPAPTPMPDPVAAVLEELAALRAEVAAVRDEARQAAGAAVRLEQRVAAGLPLRVRAGLLGTVVGTVGGA